MNQTSTGVFASASAVAVQYYFDSSVNEQSKRNVYTQLGFQDLTVNQQDTQMDALAGPGLARLIAEGAAYETEQRYREYPVTVNVRKYGVSIGLTEEVEAWLAGADTGKVISEVKARTDVVTQSVLGKINQQASQVLHLGFTSTSPVNNDTGLIGNSETLFGSHTIRGDASTQRNTFATGDTHRPLSPSALVDAITIMNRYKSHSTIELLPVTNLLLVVSKENDALATQILTSLQGPNTPNLGNNQASESQLNQRGFQIKKVVDPWIPSGSSTYWFLIDLDRANNRWFMAYLWKLRLTQEASPSTGSMQYLGSAMFRPVCIGWQHVFGSLGTNAII